MSELVDEVSLETLINFFWLIKAQIVVYPVSSVQCEGKWLLYLLLFFCNFELCPMRCLFSNKESKTTNSRAIYN